MGFVMDKCCFFIDLKVGSLIIGYLGMAGSLILTLISIFAIAATGYVTANAEQEQTQIVGTVMLVMLCIFLFLVLLHLIFDIVLLVGLHKHKRGHVKAYVIFNSIFVVIGALMFIGFIATGQGIWEIIKALLIVVCSVYFLLVIRSYYLKMDNMNKRPAMYNTA